MSLALISNQPLGIALLAQTQMRKPSGLPNISTGREHGFPVAMARVISGLGFNSTELVTATKPYGGITMRLLGQSGITLEEDHSSFKMHKMMFRSEQLLHIKEATNLKDYTWESEAKAHGQMRTLVLSLEQYHAHYYQIYEKGMTKAMVGLQGLHCDDAFRHPNISSNMKLKSFCPWCFKLEGTLKQLPPTSGRCTTKQQLLVTSAGHLPVWAQSILDHCSGCKVRCTKQCIEQERHKKAQKVTQEEDQVMRTGKGILITLTG